MRPHRVQQLGHTSPRLPEVYRMPTTDTYVHSGYVLLGNERLRVCTNNNGVFIILLLFSYCNHSTFCMQVPNSL